MRPGKGSARPPGAEPPTALANPPWRGPSCVRRRYRRFPQRSPPAREWGSPGFHASTKHRQESPQRRFVESSCPHRCGLSTAPMILSRWALDVANLNGVAPSRASQSQRGDHDDATAHRAAPGRPPHRSAAHHPVPYDPGSPRSAADGKPAAPWPTPWAPHASAAAVSAMGSAAMGGPSPGRPRAAPGEPPPTHPEPGGRGLVMMSDPDLLDGVLRLAAAAGCEMLRVLDPLQARRGWADAPVVVLDADAALRCGQAGLPRRDNVLVVVRAEPPRARLAARGRDRRRARRLPAGWRDLAGPGARRGGGGAHRGPPPRRGRRGRGRMRRRGRLGLRRSTRGHGRAPRRPGAARRLRPARRRARPGARRRAGRGPALARDRRRRRPRSRCGVACRAARAAGHRRRGGRAGAALVRPVPARAHGGRRRRGSRGRTAGGRDRGVRRTPLPHRSLDHRARRRRPDASGRAGRRPRERRRGAGGRAIGRVRRRLRLAVRGPSPGGIAAEEISRALDVPLLVAMRPEPGLARTVEAGRSRRAAARPARSRGQHGARGAGPLTAGVPGGVRS